jgi:hypothetical protein
MGNRIRLAVGCALAGLAIAGCGPTLSSGAAASGGSASPPAARHAFPRTSVTATSLPVALAGPPASWLSRLGEHVRIEPPTPNPAPDTPQWVVSSYVNHLVSADGGSACGYLVAGASASCALGYDRNVAAGYDVTYAYQSFGLGYVAVYDENKALAGTVRTGLCDHPVENNCIADNGNPAALLDSGQSFAALWRAAHHPNGSYTLTPLVKVHGTWYIDTAAILGG